MRIHGTSGNEVYQLANTKKIKTQTFDYENAFFYSETLSKSDIQDAATKLQSNWKNFQSYMKDYNKNNDKDISIGQALENYQTNAKFCTVELTYLKTISFLKSKSNMEMK